MGWESGKMDVSKALTVLLLGLSFCHAAQSQTKYQVLHSFGSGSDGGGPVPGVTVDDKGRVYGATSGGGTYNGGIVFGLTQQPNGKWSEKILHNVFESNDDAATPNGGLVQGKGGHWYGTSQGGGIGFLNGGTVFDLTHTPSGWQETVLYSFGTQSDDGGQPTSGVIMDEAGNLYGTAPYGGSTAFKLSPGPDGWEETTLHHFGVEQGDGAAPFAGLVLDTSGNLYGTTAAGGQACSGEGCGTVYELSPMPDGSWQETVLYRFKGDGKDGVFPGNGALAMDSAGNLYGTTQVGGRYGWGIIYRLKRKPDGTWREKILHTFDEGKRGAFPSGGVVMDGAGNLYGVTAFGGSACDCGVIYKVAPGPNDTWTYSVLHRFKGYDGAMPEGNLVFDQKGNLYGTTKLGGAYGPGVAFKLTP